MALAAPLHSFHCKICSVSFKTNQALEKHQEGKKHKNRAFEANVAPAYRTRKKPAYEFPLPNNTNMIHFLPPELLVYTFSSLSARTLSLITTTCHYWARILGDDHVWKSCFFTRYSKAPIHSPFTSFSWRTLTKERARSLAILPRFSRLKCLDAKDTFSISGIQLVKVGKDPVLLFSQGHQDKRIVGWKLRNTISPLTLKFYYTPEMKLLESTVVTAIKMGNGLEELCTGHSDGSVVLWKWDKTIEQWKLWRWFEYAHGCEITNVFFDDNLVFSVYLLKDRKKHTPPHFICF